MRLSPWLTPWRVRAVSVVSVVSVVLGLSTVQAERAVTVRPPPPVPHPGPGPRHCTDPVEGVWVARKYWPVWHEWVTFTVTIRRTAPGAATLEGSIENHGWTGEEGRYAPPERCDGDMVDNVVMESAGGLYIAPALTFNGTAWSLREHRCRAWSTYHLDHLVGTVDPGAETITLANTDGGRDRHEPYVFHRVRCV